MEQTDQRFKGPLCVCGMTGRNLEFPTKKCMLDVSRALTVHLTIVSAKRSFGGKVLISLAFPHRGMLKNGTVPQFNSLIIEKQTVCKPTQSLSNREFFGFCTKKFSHFRLLFRTPTPVFLTFFVFDSHYLNLLRFLLRLAFS